MTPLPCSPAAERNKIAILEAMQGVLPERGRLLELASGTGQHAAWLSLGLPGWQWQPTEFNPTALPSIAEWAKALQAPRVLAPCVLDATDPVWPSDPLRDGHAFAQAFDAAYCANMLHIAPWAACLGLMAGAARHLEPGGLLLIYGPFIEEGLPTAPGNLAFDNSLRSQNPAWGLRERTAVNDAAAQCGLRPSERIAMPANNLLLVFESARGVSGARPERIDTSG